MEENFPSRPNLIVEARPGQLRPIPRDQLTHVAYEDIEILVVLAQTTPPPPTAGRTSCGLRLLPGHCSFRVPTARARSRSLKPP